MANRQIFQLNTRSLAATDVLVSQDAAGAVEAGKSTLQSLKEFSNGGGKRLTISLSVSPSVSTSIVENDFGVTISSASVIGNGQVSIQFSSSILTSGKTQFVVQSLISGSAPYFMIGERFSATTMILNIFLHDGTRLSTPNFSDFIFTIIVYP